MEDKYPGKIFTTTIAPLEILSPTVNLRWSNGVLEQAWYDRYSGKSEWREIPKVNICEHVLYKTGDLDAPFQIKDRNGEVVLNMCRKCRKAEAELEERK